jgi:hypothetical protein
LARYAIATFSSASSARRRGQRQLDVFEDRQISDQVEALEDVPDLAVADDRSPWRVEELDWFALETVLPAVGVSRRPIMESRVDFPQPEGPDTAR